MIVELDKIIESIRMELEEYERTKEELVGKARVGIKACGDAIVNAHRGNLDKCRAKIGEASLLIKEMNNIVKNAPNMNNLAIFSDLYQEYAEAKLFLEFIERKLYPDLQQLQIPGKAYVLGMADLIGELRRYALNSIRKEKTDEAEYTLEVMEEIFDNIYMLESPKSLLAGLRHKCDIARSVIEKTRGDVTSAISNTRLQKSMNSLLKKIDDSKQD